MSSRMMYYNEDKSRLEQMKWLSNLEYEILTQDPNDDDKPDFWNIRDLGYIQDALLSLDQMTDETYEERKHEYLDMIWEDAYVDTLIDIEFSNYLSGIND